MTLTYSDAGVDIDTANAFVKRIKPLAKRTHTSGTLAGLGNFGALFELPIKDYINPVLVSSTDGVGTKLKLAQMLGEHQGLGIDLVAMCVNDILVQGAKPLFFLDYFATGKLKEDVAYQVMVGISEGCKAAGLALIGGETAEMPGVYPVGTYDLAGFVVGIVEKSRIIDGSTVRVRDRLIGLPASGLHANGFSLVRHVLSLYEKSLDSKLSLQTALSHTSFAGRTLGDCLLTPTRIYANTLLALQKQITPHAMAHITGGGLIENIPRVLPPYTRAALDRKSWQMPEIFAWLQKQGNISDHEMYRTFNCGVGMVLCVAPEDEKPCLTILRSLGAQPFVIGSVEPTQQQAPDVTL